MPKAKTSKTTAKRFKKSGTGKLMHNNTGVNHLMMHKGGSRKRRLKQADELDKTMQPRVNAMLPYGPPQ